MAPLVLYEWRQKQMLHRGYGLHSEKPVTRKRFSGKGLLVRCAAERRTPAGRVVWTCESLGCTVRNPGESGPVVKRRGLPARMLPGKETQFCRPRYKLHGGQSERIRETYSSAGRSNDVVHRHWRELHCSGISAGRHDHCGSHIGCHIVDRRHKKE